MCCSWCIRNGWRQRYNVLGSVRLTFFTWGKGYTCYRKHYWNHFELVCDRLFVRHKRSSSDSKMDFTGQHLFFNYISILHKYLDVNFTKIPDWILHSFKFILRFHIPGRISWKQDQDHTDDYLVFLLGYWNSLRKRYQEEKNSFFANRFYCFYFQRWLT